MRAGNRYSHSTKLGLALWLGALGCAFAALDAAALTPAHFWSQRFGGTSSNRGYAVAVDGSGNVVVTGSFVGTANFGGANLVSAGGYDVFVAKYNAAGVHQWSQRFGGTSDDQGRAVAVDGSGNTAVMGYYQGTVNFGGGNLVSAGSYDIFVARYDSAGVHQWSQRFGSTASDMGYDVAEDGSGNVLVTGNFVGTVNFGGGNLVSAGGSVDIFVAKYDAAGVHQWSQRFGSTAFDEGRSIAVDGPGNVLVTGLFPGTVNFGGANLVSAGSYDVFVAKYNAAGVHQWSQRFGSTLEDDGNGVAVDGPGNVAVTGNFQGTVDFGGGNLVSAGSDDIFVAKYSSEVAEPVLASVSDVSNDQGRSVMLEFSRSGHDLTASATPIVQYEAFRRSDPLPGGVLSGAESAPATSGWTFAGAIPAHRETTYTMIAPTLADSTITNGQYYSAFFIRAATADPGVYFDSPADSGYSLDNIPPALPANLAYTAGILGWDESKAVDFDYFSVYGSNTNSFGSATLVDYAVAPTLDVTASSYAYYFATATDFSGNEGKPAVVNTLSGVGGTPTSYVLSVSAYPNPFNPETTIRYTLPSKGHVTIAIYDARGAHVATLLDADKPEGAYTIDWHGEDGAGGRVGSGVYFARLALGGETRSYKLVLLK